MRIATFTAKLIATCGVFILFIILLVLKEETRENSLRSSNVETSYSDWLDQLNFYPIRRGSIEIVHHPSEFDSDATPLKEVLLQPNHICLGTQDDIYISDSGNHCLFRISTKNKDYSIIGGRGNKIGEYSFPKYISSNEAGKLFVYDVGHNRIQVIDEEGNLFNCFGITKPYTAMKTRNGAIYLLALSDKINEPLIDVFDERGISIRQFGERRCEWKRNRSIIVSGLLDIGGNEEIFVIPETYPLLRKYDSQGGMLEEILIANRLLLDIGEHNYRIGPSLEPKTFRKGIGAVYSNNESVFVMLVYPRLEIIELDSHGNQINTYWKETTYGSMPVDFIVKEDKYTKEKSFLLLFLAPAPQLLECSAR